MNQRILLVEPAYKTKYPPLGLMKLATYHKQLNDHVTFVKGCDASLGYEYWDRVYITTLFTYTWKETVKTINFYKDQLFLRSHKIFVGGILASLMPDDLFDETGIYPIEGLLDDPTKIEQKDNCIIDNLSPDYEILKQVNFDYAYTDAYIGYTTRGCPRKCEFCAVKTFEPEYVSYINIKKMIDKVDKQLKEKDSKRDLLLMDNNVLHSKDFDRIIDDIKKAGFIKGVKYKGKKRKRIVDFNQGLDARKLTKAKMRRLAEIPLDPMRIAFDNIKLKTAYIKAVRLAHEYKQKNMSNYILYNFYDTPDEFYERLKINIDLNEEFREDFENNKGVKTAVYSFPMRYIPLKAKDRNIDKKNDFSENVFWKKRYLRGLQLILNVIKGPVMPGKQFFEQAFGKSPKEFKAYLLMPDEYIRFRVIPNWRKIKDHDKRLMPYVREWKDIYWELSEDEQTELAQILSSNDLQKRNYNISANNKRINKLLKLYPTAEETVKKKKHAT